MASDAAGGGPGETGTAWGGRPEGPAGNVGCVCVEGARQAGGTGELCAAPCASGAWKLNGGTAGGVTGRLGAEGAVVGGVEGADSIAAWAGSVAGTSGIIRTAATMTGTAEAAATEATARGTAFGGGTAGTAAASWLACCCWGRGCRPAASELEGSRREPWLLERADSWEERSGREPWLLERADS